MNISNKTLKDPGDEIVSVRKYLRVFVAVLLLFLIVGVTSIPKTNGSTIQSKFGNKLYNLEIAKSEAEHVKGLSGRNKLPLNSGMLFVFNSPQIQCFWMKDMNFNLDILWLDSSKHIIFIKQNLPPSSYPNSYCSDIPAKYVVELNAGETQAHNIKLAQTVDLNL